MEFNPFSLKDKKILITGASSGIGKATAIACSKMGATVFITGRDKYRLRDTFHSLEGGGHLSIEADLMDSADLTALINALPVIDGCFNNAGVMNNIPVMFIKEQSLNDILAINTIAPILLIQQLLKAKKIANGASIVFTLSISGIYCSAVASSLYSTTKGAMDS